MDFDCLIKRFMAGANDNNLMDAQNEHQVDGMHEATHFFRFETLRFIFERIS